MTIQHLPQLAAALLVVVIPLGIVRVALALARRHAAESGAGPLMPISLRALQIGTRVGAAVAGVAALALAPPSLLSGVINVALFMVLAAVASPVLATIHRAARTATQAPFSIREASLGPRRISDVLPVSWRVSLYAGTIAGAAAFGLRWIWHGAPREPFVPAVFAGAAIVFVVLYDVWIRELVTGPVLAGAPPEAEHRARLRRVRALFAGQVLLSVACLCVAHGLLSLDFETHELAASALSIFGAVVGFAGCAVALALPLTRRAYQAASR
jgi:hypothetical protein